MKRHFMKSLKALGTGVMTLCVASLSFVSCYDDSALNGKLDELGNAVSAIDTRLKAVEALTTQLEALTERVEALYTLKFQVTSSNELQYSFDGGQTWLSTGITLAKELECECEEPIQVALEDNGSSVTITVGEQSFTIEKPQEIVFEIRAGKVYFESEGTQTVAMKTAGVEDLTVISYPKGWWAEINADGLIEVTAPNYEETQSQLDYETWTEIPAKYAAHGYVKVHACGADGKCMNESGFIFYGNKEGAGIMHTGDNLTGDGDGDDEQIIVDLNNVPADVQKIAFTVTIYDADKRAQNFGMVENSFIRIFDSASGTELLRYDLGEDYSIETAVVVGELYRHNGEWKFNAVGSGFQGGLAALCANYGINVG